MPEQKKFYLTTPIYYVNARPHIGHAYTTLTADTIARRKRLEGYDVRFLTGTDEHGQKIQRSADAAGIAPQQFADEVSASFRSLWERMGITYDDYIRTTEPRHKQGVQVLFRKLYDKGFIYLDSYTGAYCVSDEAFVDLPVGTPCPDCGRPLEEVTEENFFFRLSQFAEPLIEKITSGELCIEPASRRNEVLSFLQGGLKDLSISRSSFTWGIPVPKDVQQAAGAKHEHVVYVWLDALANYMTALGYGSADDALWQKYWPADLHLVGKEIIRFHCVYWPAFLLAAELPLPKKVQAHGWLLFEESKMSKSRGNIVRSETILDAFGSLKPELSKREQDLFATDVLRYFLLREIPFGQDGSFSFDALVTRYNADLANGYGNLVSRTLKLVSTHFSDGILPPQSWQFLDRNTYEPSEIEKRPSGSFNILQEAAIQVHSRKFLFDECSFNIVLSEINGLISEIDEYLSFHKPWHLAKMPENREKLSECLYVATEVIRQVTLVLAPFLPFTTAVVAKQLGFSNFEDLKVHGLPKEEDIDLVANPCLPPIKKLGTLAPIFPRADKELITRMNETEQQNRPAGTADLSATDAKSASSGRDDVAAGVKVEAVPTTDDKSQAIAPPADTVVAEEAKQHISIDDFIKVELRAAVVKVAERIPKADKLLRLEVDLGDEQRQILSGIAEWYTPEELIGRRIIIVANLAPRKMRGLESHGMLLAASEGENGKPMLATFAEDVAPGTRLK